MNDRIHLFDLFQFHIILCSTTLNNRITIEMSDGSVA